MSAHPSACFLETKSHDGIRGGFSLALGGDRGHVINNFHYSRTWSPEGMRWISLRGIATWCERDGDYASADLYALRLAIADD